MSGRASRTKGHDFERAVARELRDIFPGAKRGYQARGGTAAAPDVDGTPFYIECKKGTPARAWYAALLQAEAGSDGRPAVAVVQEDRGARMVAMRVFVASCLTLAHHLPPEASPSGCRLSVPILMPWENFVAHCARLPKPVPAGELDVSGHSIRQPTVGEEPVDPNAPVNQLEGWTPPADLTKPPAPRPAATPTKSLMRREDTGETLEISR